MFYRQLCLQCLKIGKFLLTVTGHAHVTIIADAVRSSRGSSISSNVHSSAAVLQKALQCVPSPHSELILANIAAKLGKIMKEQVLIYMNGHINKTHVEK